MLENIFNIVSNRVFQSKKKNEINIPCQRALFELCFANTKYNIIHSPPPHPYWKVWINLSTSASQVSHRTVSVSSYRTTEWFINSTITTVLKLIVQQILYTDGYLCECDPLRTAQFSNRRMLIKPLGVINNVFWIQA